VCVALDKDHTSDRALRAKTHAAEYHASPVTRETGATMANRCEFYIKKKKKLHRHFFFSISTRAESVRSAKRRPAVESNFGIDASEN